MCKIPSLSVMACRGMRVLESGTTIRVLDLGCEGIKSGDRGY